MVHRQPRLLIIADDLTGALDCAAPFASGDMKVVAACSVEGLGEALALDADVVAVSTRSREIGSQKAHDRVSEALAMTPDGVSVFKKVDSRMKGNVAAELAAFGSRSFIIAPAIPEFGRMVVDGMVTGFGVDSPIAIRPLLGSAGERSTVMDSRSIDELDTIVSAWTGASVLVGTRGLAMALARSMGGGAGPVSSGMTPPACIVVGSYDPITLKQVEALRRSNHRAVHVAAISGEVPSNVGQGALRIFQIEAGEERNPKIVAEKFAATLQKHLVDSQSLLLTGGATAEAVLDVLGIAHFTVIGEALPGLPLCRAGERIVITKSGGFGEEDTLVRLARNGAVGES